ncbi:U8 snoRNA-decapping enzyme-like [Schistocerca americana]|uniref:U8 snoRNA-decapping enzyme-like n=1 Tax=Schistocerca americana TaxID=7009 RepID=UPI001F4F6A7D|nr:U8 snoRNA-decapping enzyme-like [Schistocerca americana]XP_047104914.1 U8 snoRNA-decapping enzyme-like [Schistocerca piceifrons]XP_049762942.1 U8 snoRNA-decapping enzyme-like [Schistocerca cancellata]XP_049804301.1 U8 snoRNA-decapping enzyme-like isoform X1 [Schistocerca nitens]XP_049939598.1 U8 snoRNA-decapping enzyme-like [Schistocerca serialis cubense]
MTETGDGSWGHLEDTEYFGRISSTTDYAVLTKENLKESKYATCTQAAHCMIYCTHTQRIFDLYSARAAVLMQMRFDGYIGFPGGLIDEGEDVITGLNRELVEEMNISPTRNLIKDENHIVSHWNKSTKLVLNFYAVEVTMDELFHIEKNSVFAHDYGTEVLGTLRVPLYTMGDGYRGFPNFLNNKFCGNSKQQLLYSLHHLGLMTEEEIQNAVNAKPVSA